MSTLPGAEMLAHSCSSSTNTYLSHVSLIGFARDRDAKAFHECLIIVLGIQKIKFEIARELILVVTYTALLLNGHLTSQKTTANVTTY
jgi:hypothetical protein